MCLYPRLMINKKYTETKKNKGVIPPLSDYRIKYVSIGCQECKECRDQKKREWQIRIKEECKENKNGKFITLTFNTESLREIYENVEEKLVENENKDADNVMATYAVRHFLERWRKKYKKSVRHWLVTELGHDKTEHIHLHGIIWTNENYETIENIWKYGFIWPTKHVRKKTYVNGRTVNYLIKYISKLDNVHPWYKSIILCSPGIGRHYEKRLAFKENKYKQGKTKETYTNESGRQQALPIYYRNKIYTEEEREKLWIEKLDKGDRWIMGIKITKDTPERTISAILKQAQKINKELGYGGLEKDWEEIEYLKKLRNLNRLKRIGKVEIKEGEEEHIWGKWKNKETN